MSTKEVLVNISKRIMSDDKLREQDLDLSIRALAKMLEEHIVVLDKKEKVCS